MSRLHRCRERRNKGSVTLEFIMVIPLVIFMCLFVGQFVVTGMAVLETHHFVKDGVRSAASSGKPQNEEKQGKVRFDKTSHYWLSDYEVKIKDGQVIATAVTKIKWIFLPIDPFTYQYVAKSPVIK
ncbi:TadE/TadG family type IV pilus assembly protein [Laceyella tengchongensis]